MDYSTTNNFMETYIKQKEAEKRKKNRMLKPKRIFKGYKNKNKSKK